MVLWVLPRLVVRGIVNWVYLPSLGPKRLQKWGHSRRVCVWCVWHRVGMIQCVCGGWFSMSPHQAAPGPRKFPYTVSWLLFSKGREETIPIQLNPVSFQCLFSIQDQHWDAVKSSVPIAPPQLSHLAFTMTSMQVSESFDLGQSHEPSITETFKHFVPMTSEQALPGWCHHFCPCAILSHSKPFYGPAGSFGCSQGKPWWRSELELSNQIFKNLEHNKPTVSVLKSFHITTWTKE